MGAGNAEPACQDALAINQPIGGFELASVPLQELTRQLDDPRVERDLTVAQQHLDGFLDL
jgi:hypothetical protein